MKKETNCNAAFEYPELDKMSDREFYETYRSFMYSIVKSEGLDHYQGDIAINDVLITIFMKHRCYFDPKKSRFSNYLATMVRNACRSLKRKERRYVNAEEDELVRLSESNGAVTSARNHASNEIRLWIDEAIKILRKEMRSQLIVDAFVMTVIEEERPLHVAQKLNVRPAYVSLAKNRCRPRFQTILRRIIDSDK